MIKNIFYPTIILALLFWLSFFQKCAIGQQPMEIEVNQNTVVISSTDAIPIKDADGNIIAHAFVGTEDPVQLQKGILLNVKADFVPQFVEVLIRKDLFTELPYQELKFGQQYLFIAKPGKYRVEIVLINWTDNQYAREAVTVEVEGESEDPDDPKDPEPDDLTKRLKGYLNQVPENFQQQHNKKLANLFDSLANGWAAGSYKRSTLRRSLVALSNDMTNEVYQMLQDVGFNAYKPFLNGVRKEMSDNAENEDTNWVDVLRTIANVLGG